MKATELRIGNWVDQPNEGVTKVTSILNDLQIRTETGYVDKYCRAIPLTEEWLLKFGFEEEIKEGNSSDFWVYYKSNLTFNSNHGWWYRNQHLDNQPKHVHQLQNLYFALIGEELELKDKDE